MKIVQSITILALSLALQAAPAQAYNILALDMGGYWNNLYDQYFGAQSGYGTPGRAGERWYTMVSPADLVSVDLMRYDVLLVQSAFTDDWVLETATAALAALNAKSSDISDFVRAGNGLVACSEPLPGGSSNPWGWSPVSVASRGGYHENSVEIAQPFHPAMSHSTNQSLSDWHSSWHGWFESWDPRLQPLALSGDYGAGDPRTHRALTLGGTYWDGGCGRMVFTMQDPDYHAYQGFDGAKTFMRDALDWSATCGHPVPEPGAAVLLLVGLGGLAWGAQRRRR